jgi:hypothetical protein
MTTHEPWLSEPANEVEAELAAALEEARARLPDEVTLRRLWSKIASPDLERPARSRWPWFVGGVITSSALAVALGVWLVPMHPHTRLIVGSVAPSPEETAVVSPAVPGAPLAQGAATDSDVKDPAGKDSDAATPVVPVSTPKGGAPATVRTAAGQTRRFALRGGTVTRLAPSSVMTVTPQGDGTDRPTVEKGEVAFSVPHQAPGRNFSVAAGPYRIVVMGTKFRLHVEGTNVAVAVDEGVVEVWRKRRMARLTSGDSWSSPSDRGGATADGPATGPAEPQVAAPSPVPAPAAPPMVAPAAPPPVAVDPMQEARAALAAGEPHRALEAYRAAIARGGPIGENAGYEIGRVMRDRLQQPADAIAAWKRYRSAHPNGLLRVETDVSIIETLVASGDSSGALSEATDFLKHHAESERRAEIARITGDLYRERGDCNHAVGAYQTALAASRTREITEYSSFQRAACLVSLGESSGNVALQEYLHAWPRGRFSGDASRLLQATNDHAKVP